MPLSGRFATERSEQEIAAGTRDRKRDPKFQIRFGSIGDRNCVRATSKAGNGPEFTRFGRFS